MRGGVQPLLCELHAHTTWSDGELSLAAVVDLTDGPASKVAMDDGPAAAMETARGSGDAGVGGPPHNRGSTPAVPFPISHFAGRRRELRGLFDRVELFNGRQLFGWVAEAGLPGVACGVLHRAEHLPGWTTLVPCDQDPEALVDHLRSSRARLPGPPRASRRRACCLAGSRRLRRLRLPAGRGWPPPARS
jgi:hypothetical protein